MLAVTVGTWLSFVAAFQGGIWEQIAGYTPSEMLQAFRRGLVRLDLVLAALVLIAASLVIGAVWMRLGVPVRRRATESAVILCVAAVLAFAASFGGRAGTFRKTNGTLCRVRSGDPEQITAPLKIEAHLAPRPAAFRPRKADPF